MTKRTPRDREHRKVLEEVRELRKRGYTVDMYPKSADLPRLLTGYQPDIIARSESETLVVEVRSRNTYADMGRLAEIANKIQAEPGWRFELVLTNPSKRDLKPIISLQQISRRLTVAKRLAASPENSEAALLLAWSAIEPLIRLRKRTLSSVSLAKTAYSLGLVNKRKLEVLEWAAALRNDVVHGFAGATVNPTDLQALVELGHELLDDRQALLEALAGPVDDLDISVRTRDLLFANNIESVGDLVGHEEIDLLRRDFGPDSLQELIQVLEERGLVFGMDVDRYFVE